MRNFQRGGEVPTRQIEVYIGEDHRSYHLHLFLFLRHHFCIFIHIRDTQGGKSTKVPYAKTAQNAPRDKEVLEQTDVRTPRV
jgi:hypothetical protein